MNAQTSIMNETFESAAMLTTRVREFAKSEGFAVVTRNSNFRSLTLCCVHHSESRNYRKLTVDGKDGSTKRKIVKSSMRIGCDWTLRASLKTSMELPYWKINKISGTHNHRTDGRNPMIYHQHRVLTDDDHQLLNQYISAKIKSRQIYELLRDANRDPKWTIKKLYFKTLSSQPETERVARLMEYLASREYVAMYASDQERQLKHIYFSHRNAINLARRFHEVVLIDTTYKTNRQGLLFVNIVGISNVGTRRHLNTSTIAGSLIVTEDEYALSWILKQLKETVFTNGETPIFVTDAAMQLRNAIRAIFPESKHMLCTWHIMNNFEARLQKTFQNDDDWIKLKESLDLIIRGRSQKAFDIAIKDYKEDARASNDPKDCIDYLERRLKDATMWVGMHTSKLLHFGATTTQRVEGSHASIKNVLERRQNIEEVIDRIDIMYHRKREEAAMSLQLDDVSFDAFMTAADKMRLAPLMPNITRFALQKILEENTQCSPFNRDGNCCCVVKVNFNLPCRHILPPTGPIPLSFVAKRWHLRPTSEHDVQSTEMCDFDMGDNESVVATARQFLYKLDDKIASGNLQQQVSLMKNLAWMHENAYDDVRSLKMPVVVSKKDNYRSTKRDAIDVEHAERERLIEKKRAKLMSAKERSSPVSCGPKSSGSTAKAEKPLDQAQTIGKLQPALPSLPDYLPSLSSMDVFNPIADGNCGFRALAQAVYGTEEQWRKVKDDLLEKYRQELLRYTDIHGFDQPTIERILTNRSSGCGPDSWFQFPDCCQLASGVYKRAICFYSAEQQYTFLTTMDQPKFSSIGLWLQNSHIQLLSFRSGFTKWPPLIPGHNDRCKLLKGDDWRIK